MALTKDQQAAIRQRLVNDLKQACLDLQSAALEMFDRFDAHGMEAAWKGDGALVVMRLAKAYEEIRAPLARQATSRMMALGVPLEKLLGGDVGHEH